MPETFPDTNLHNESQLAITVTLSVRHLVRLLPGRFAMTAPGRYMQFFYIFIRQFAGCCFSSSAKDPKVSPVRWWGLCCSLLVIGIVLTFPPNVGAETNNTMANAATSPPNMPEQLVVVGNHAPPYRIFLDSSSSGLYVDTAKVLAKRLGVSLRFEAVPFKRALFMMEHGQADMMLGPNRTPEREQYMLYLDASLPAEAKALYVLPQSPRIRQYEDLKGLHVAVISGNRYSPRFDNDESIFKEPVSGYLQALGKVETGRNDVAVIPEMLGDYLVRKNGMNVVKSPYRIAGRRCYFTLSRKSPFMLHSQTLEDVLRTLIHDGTFETIEASYR